MPVVIALHGGPGTPVPLSVGCRGMFPEFTDHFIMVYWDQLGCGINNDTIDDSFNISSFTDMTRDLISEIAKLFPQNKIYIFSTSWGSVLSALISSVCPDKISGVVACGQIIKDLFFNDEVLSELERSNIPKKKLEALKNANSGNATAKELRLMSACLRRYTDAYYNARGKKMPLARIMKGLITSPDYKLKDLKAIAINGYRGNHSIWNELLQIDLTDVLAHVTIPYMILQGDTDIVASTQSVIALVESAANDNLTYSVVKDSGHLPGVDMMDRILEALKELSQ